MSNGGYMSYRLACDLSFKTSAIASVTGSMTPETFNTCSPNHPTAVLQIHGDVDGVVPYYGDWKGRSIPDVMNYWKKRLCLLQTDYLLQLPQDQEPPHRYHNHFLLL